MLGVDVSKATLSCTLLDPTTRSILWQTSVSNTKDGIASLLERTPFATPLALEPTGSYSLLLARTAKEQGRLVYLAEPRKAKHFLCSLPKRAKTDTLDSQGLALYALSCPLRPYPVKDEAVESLDQLLSARRSLTDCLSRLRQQEETLLSAKDYLKDAIAALEEQKTALEKEIAKRIASDPRFHVAALLQSVPGIGPVTSASVASALVAKEFTDPDQFVAYIGLDPSTRQSGQVDGHGALSKRGNPELRRLLYLSAQANLRCKSSPFQVMYQRYRDKGLPTTAALCAVARKIARTCWSLHKHNTAFDPDRVLSQNQQPTKTLDNKP